MRFGYSVIIIFRTIDCQVNVIQDSVILAVLHYGHCHMHLTEDGQGTTKLFVSHLSEEFSVDMLILNWSVQ